MNTRTSPVGKHLREVPPEWNTLTERVIGCAMAVHSELGPGLLERLYEDAFEYEVRNAGLKIERQVLVRMRYKDMELGEQRLDCVVERFLVVELKSVEQVADLHLAQLVSYLRSARLPLGLLINFNVAKLVEGLHRRINSNALPLASASSAPLRTSAFSEKQP